MCERIVKRRKRNAMQKLYHISLSSTEDELLFRSEADLVRGFNYLATAILETDSRLLADGILTTHLHCMALTDCPKELITQVRYSLARYFNAMYARKGMWGERNPFILEVDGFHHTLAALNYVNRQALHHGLSPTPFGYRHCSANAFFRKQLGKEERGPLLPTSQRYKYLSSRTSLPERYRMDDSGLLLREDILEIAHVESLYGTPRNYLYQMNKIGDEKGLQEQREEKSSSPLITLELMEQGVPDNDISTLLRNESGKHNPNRILDLELCSLIDKTFVPLMSGSKETSSIYQIPYARRLDLFDYIRKNLWTERKKFATDDQLKRCLCLGYR